MEPYLEELVRDNISSADAVASKVWKKAPHSLDLDELKSIAYFGLVSAAVRWEAFCSENGYDYKRTEYFKVYASKRIQGAIYDSFRDNDWATRALRAKSKLLTEAGSEEGTSEKELIEKTGLSKKQVRSTMTRMANKPIPLDAAVVGEYEPQISDPTELVVESNLILATFADAVLALPPDQQTIIILKYFEGIDLKEVARRMNMPNAEVSSLHTEAVLLVYEILAEYLEAERMS